MIIKELSITVEIRFSASYRPFSPIRALIPEGLETVWTLLPTYVETILKQFNRQSVAVSKCLVWSS